MGHFAEIQGQMKALLSTIFHSGGMDGCGGSTRTSELILSRFGMERAKVMENLKVRRSGRRGFSTRTLLQIYGLKVSLVNLTV